jgi:hypothetical protein
MKLNNNDNRAELKEEITPLHGVVPSLFIDIFYGQSVLCV